MVVDFLSDGSSERVCLVQCFDFLVGKPKISAIQPIWRIPIGVNWAKARRVFGSSLIREKLRDETRVRTSCILVQQSKCCLFPSRSHCRTAMLSQICRKDSQLLISSLLKNCFGSPFRASKRRGTSLFIGFSRAAMPYCAHSSTFKILFQQAVSRVIGN